MQRWEEAADVVDVRPTGHGKQIAFELSTLTKQDVRASVQFHNPAAQLLEIDVQLVYFFYI